MAACIDFNQEIDTGELDSLRRRIVLFVRLYEYRGMVVDFCFRVVVVDSDDVETEVERVDCCHGVVHRHYFDSEGVDLGRRLELRRLFDQDGVWQQVDAICSEQNDYYFDNYHDIVRRWER